MGSYMNFKNFADTPQTESNGGMSMGSGNFPLVRQSSVYSLTFDELQSTCGLGKDLGSMNLEDLLKNIWTAEESNVVASAAGVGNANTAGGNLQRQGSLTLPRTLSQKTVDEVWRDFQKETTVSSKDGSGTEWPNLGQRQSTLGEMTLEEFLVRAGVVREDMQPTGSSTDVRFTGALSQPSTNNNGLNIAFQQPTQNPGLFSNQFEEKNMLNVVSATSSQQKPSVAFASPMQLGNNGQLANTGARTPAVSMSSPSVSTSTIVQGSVMQGGFKGLVGLCNGVTPAKRGSPGNQQSPDMIAKKELDRSSLSPSPYAFSEGGKGRRSCNSLEKVVERRRKRMIKNRESAARSRARKQAYTLELEAEVEKLKEINEELQRKQAEFIEMQKDQLIEKMKMSWGNKLRCLRRTLTGPW
ncbi:PREDICTED: bZIP transcription factor TRAB1-like [Nicotiana attenuata]|uniref:Abscisic acid-insensitive 5-like protein 7 n=1 Tax=Nicotiana attenuata TaxID=49451 RepID=A0A1J6ICJ8_NICAT|nr:PREDICTED: bZIP transcription factor TRAB1-like [Nicotiana attenuata]XP_019254919.1 PREDICTED: bZIP transcription factor TRAB1-like [Nicotiana attenuata]OIS98231.1 abscisic acid-insensitive 5-like protein 7 [Nicotiana attenuata]